MKRGTGFCGCCGGVRRTIVQRLRQSITKEELMNRIVLVAMCAVLAAPAWAGTATYDGLGGGAVALPGTSGLAIDVEVEPGVFESEIFEWVPNGDGTYSINSVGIDPDPGAGRVKGVFSLNDGVTPLQIVDGNAYSVTGTCVIPASGVDANGENYRVMVLHE